MSLLMMINIYNNKISKTKNKLSEREKLLEGEKVFFLLLSWGLQRKISAKLG